MNEHSCDLCPRMCGADRSLPSDEQLQKRQDTQRSRTGFCRQTGGMKAARAALHLWEEPCISGVRGSGTIFFSGCTLRCCFCQNYRISSEGFGKKISVRQLADIFLRLQDQGAHNINLVTATQFLPSVLKALDLVRHRLTLPVVYNSSGYERPEIIGALDGYVDIYLPDLKYYGSDLSDRCSQAPDYFEIASRAIPAMIRQAGRPVFTEWKGPSFDGSTASCRLLTRGVIIRHMVLPGCREDSVALLRWMRDQLPEKQYLISLLSQFTPCYQCEHYPELNRRITSYEYQRVVDEAVRLGLTDGYMQKKSSAREEYTPPFDLEGID